MTDFEKALEENAEKSAKESCDSKYEWQNYEEIFYAGAIWARDFTVREICEWLVSDGQFIVRNHCPANLKLAIESNFKDRGGE